MYLGMNITIKSGMRKTRGANALNNNMQPPNRGFIYDLTSTTDTHVQVIWVLKNLAETIIPRMGKNCF